MFWRKKPKIEPRTVRWDIDIERGLGEAHLPPKYIVKRYLWGKAEYWDLDSWWGPFERYDQAKAFIEDYKDLPVIFTVEHTMQGGA